MDGGEIGRLMKDAFLDRRIPQKGYGDVGLAPLFHGQGRARGHGYPAADDRQAEEHARRHVENMHRSAPTAAAAAGLAVKFRQHGLQITALGQIVGMGPVGRHDLVLAPQSQTHPR